jgi:hypothetical protein
MSQMTSGFRWTPWTVFLLLCSLAGLVVPWYFNLRQLSESGPFTPWEFLRAGFTVSPLHSSIAADFWIGSTPAVLWMGVEGSRLGMKRWWLFILLTLVVAFAFAFPTFLLMRERRLASASMK